MTIRPVLLAVLIGLLGIAVWAPVEAACTGASPNWTGTWSELQACHDQAAFQNGDTYTVTAAAHSATTEQSVTKYIKIICAPGGTVTDNTTATQTPLTITESTAGSTRLEGCDFIKGAGANHVPPDALTVVNSTANGNPLLVTGNTYDYTAGGSGTWFFWKTNRGVLWLNTMNAEPTNPNCLNGASFIRVKPGGGTWTGPPIYGSADTTGTAAVYIENNTLANAEETIDVDDGGRAVIRYNTITNGAVVSHGSDTSGFGARTFEVYGNTFVYDGANRPLCGTPINLNAFLAWRGGTSVVWGNVVPDIGNEGVWGPKAEVISYYEQLRRNAGPYHCFANQGVDRYPGPMAPGWGYLTGATAADGGATDCNGAPCSGGTNNQDLEPIYFMANSGGADTPGGYVAPSISNYQGTNECGASAGTVGTYIQLDREIYGQMSATVNSGPSSGPTPFTGATKTGYGPIASRPDACTPGSGGFGGVAYWATDEGGNWNTANADASNDGKMYICTATNTWTAKYGANSTGTNGIPYQYPHTLTVGSGGGPTTGGGRLRLRY